MTATCHTVEHKAYCEAVHEEIGLLASVVRGADTATPVPTCPEWDLRRLVRHVGGVHRWAAAMVDALTPVPFSPADVDLAFPADDGLADWLLDGRDKLLAALGRRDPDAGMWAWGSDPHVRFWSRRMVHETIVHRADAEIALGAEPAIDDTTAVDGIDEFFDNLPHAALFAPNVNELRGTGERVGFRSPQAAWIVTLGPDAFAWEHASEADVTVCGPAPDLLLVVYGRRPPVAVDGDRDLLERWMAKSSI